MNKLRPLCCLIAAGLLLSTCASPAPKTLAPSQPPKINPTVVAIYDSSEQITDGDLALSINIPTGSCYSMRSNIPVELTFHNLTAKPIMLQSRLSISTMFLGASDLVAITKSESGSSIYSVPMINQPFVSVPLPRFQSIPARGLFQAEVQYRFPIDDLNMNGTGGPRTAVAASNQYSIRLVYQNDSPFNVGAWVGMIASNQIAVCISS